MTSTAQIFNWLNELREGKKFKPDSVLIQQVMINGQLSTQIRLLDLACCMPAILIPKKHSEIEKADFTPWTQAINHKH